MCVLILSTVNLQSLSSTPVHHAHCSASVNCQCFHNLACWNFPWSIVCSSAHWMEHRTVREGKVARNLDRAWVKLCLDSLQNNLHCPSNTSLFSYSKFGISSSHTFLYREDLCGKWCRRSHCLWFHLLTSSSSAMMQLAPWILLARGHLHFFPHLRH